MQASEAESYEERSAIRQALRRKKKDRGENVGRSRARGNSVYNRFAGSTAPPKQTPPKNYVIGEGESAATSTPARPVMRNLMQQSLDDVMHVLWCVFCLH